MTTRFKDHVQAHAAGYVAHRPTDPRTRVDAFADAGLTITPSWSLSDLIGYTET